jgi:hypothetical protein
MTINYATLKTELETDPRTYGYAEHRTSGNDQALADLLNLVRATISVPRARVEAWEVTDAIDPDEWTRSSGGSSIAAAEKDRLRLLIQNAVLDPTQGNIRRHFELITVNAPLTRVRLMALAVRTGSRAEELFGPSVHVGSLDVARALRGA